MRKVIRGFEVEVVGLFEGKEDEVGVLVRRVNEKVGEFWVVKRKELKWKIVEVLRRMTSSRSPVSESFKRSFDVRFNRVWGDTHAYD